MKGYKQMIRDRMPENWVFVLKHFKVLGKWIDLVYNSRIRPWNTDWRTNERKDHKSKEVKDLFSNAKKYDEQERFWLTIDSDRMSEPERRYWWNISMWIDWFSKNYLFIKQEYTHNNGPETQERVTQIWTKNVRLTKEIFKYIDNGEKA